jgi:asparagine synthase (glutamine-hydrolysing)
MCGLSGEVRFDGAAADPGTIHRMTCAQSYRGPDGSGAWTQGPVAMGHCRLKIIDLSSAGGQPMVDAELGLSIVFNGCVYNYQELREELHGAGYRFFSTSDTEVVLKAYHRWGTACVEHFHGMFAFAVTEHGSGRTVLARDRLGIKPLYVDHTAERLRFASTVQALLAAGDVDTSIDRTALSYYLTFHSVVPAPRTVLQGVRKLPPATVRVVEADGSAADHEYWNPQFTRDEDRSAWTEQDWEEGLVEKLRTAVQRRMVADVPVGVLLSGGIDSSLVVALLAESGQQHLKTFSIGFEFSSLVARRFGTDHHQISIDDARLVPAIDRTVAAMSEPMISHDCVAFYLLSEEVSRSVKVVQSGQGADEVLGGYHWYPPLAEVERDDARQTYSEAFFDRPWSRLAKVLSPEWMATHDAPSAFIERHFGRPGAETAVDAALRTDSTVMLVDDPVKRVDNMTMAWGLEARVPFLDHELVEFAGRVPPELKLADGGKGVLKRAARGIVPDEVIDRKKGYFPVPAIRTLEGGTLARVEAALTDPAAVRRGLYNSDVVETLLADPNKHHTPLRSNVLWQLGLLEMWLQQNGIS